MTTYTTLISVEELASQIDRFLVIDVQSDLFNPALGRENYGEAHLPGAYFFDNNTDLAGPKQIENGIPVTGRHPLPNRAELASKLAACGLLNGQQVVAYDAGNGMYAARAWWLLKWLGHDAVAVLDGGLAAWKNAGYPVTADVPPVKQVNSPDAFIAKAPLVSFVPIEELMADVSAKRDYLIIDARAGERYRGETEPLDPIAGHIPGAMNRPFQSNLRPDGRFKPAQALHQEFVTALAGIEPAQVVNQCGSGVTACHNILAMTHAGLTGSLLYPGSWSEWSADKTRPVATGADRG